MKLLKLRKCLYMMLVLLLGVCFIGCDDEPVVKVPEELEVLPLNDVNIKKMEVGDTFELVVNVTPYDASWDVIWSVEPEGVATVDENGVVTAVKGGDFQVKCTSKYDSNVYAYYKNTITSIDNRENFAKIDEVIGYLSELFPDGMKVNEYLEFPTKYDELDDISISWTSANPSVLPINDTMLRGAYDQTVAVTAKVKCGGVQKEYTTNLVVESQDKVNLKSLTDHKLIIMYQYTSLSKLTKLDCQGIDIINLSFALINTSTHKLDLSHVNGQYNDIIKAHSYGIRVCLSIGGWGADGFSQACATAESRKVFVDSIMDAVKKYGYDGVDLDWEYPTSRSAGIAASGSDKVNYTLLCQELRQALDEYKPGLLLTNAVSGSDTRYYEVSKLNDVIDYWYLMTYEYNPNNVSGYDSSFNQTKTGVDKWVKAGATNTKVVLGITFYGAYYKITTNTTSGSYPGVGAPAVGGASHIALKRLYSEVIGNSNYKEYYDKDNGMAYSISKSKDANGYYTFVSYDNAESLRKKAEFIKSANLAGVMSWELGEDTAERDQLAKVISAMIRYAN